MPRLSAIQSRNSGMRPGTIDWCHSSVKAKKKPTIQEIRIGCCRWKSLALMENALARNPPKIPKTIKCKSLSIKRMPSFGKGSPGKDDCMVMASMMSIQGRWLKINFRNLNVLHLELHVSIFGDFYQEAFNLSNNLNFRK